MLVFFISQKQTKSDAFTLFTCSVRPVLGLWIDPSPVLILVLLKAKALRPA